MGELIVMTRPQVPARESSLSGASAEILFFTGVRYYRMDDEVSSQTIVRRRRPAKAAKAAAARRAKRLEETVASA